MQALCFLKHNPKAGIFAQIVQQAHDLHRGQPFWFDLPGLDNTVWEDRRKDALGRVLLLYGPQPLLQALQAQIWTDFSVLGPVDPHALWAMAEQHEGQPLLCAMRRVRREFASARRAQKKAQRLQRHLQAKGVALSHPVVPVEPLKAAQVRQPYLWLHSRSNGQNFCFFMARETGLGQLFGATPDAYGCCKQGVALPTVNERRLLSNLFGLDDA